MIYQPISQSSQGISSRQRLNIWQIENVYWLYKHHFLTCIDGEKTTLVRCSKSYVVKYFEGSQQVELDLSYATPCKKVYQRYKVYGQMHMDKMKAWGE